MTLTPTDSLRKLCSIFGLRLDQKKGEEMKRFVILHYGFEMPTPEIMDAWNKWFASIGDKIVNPGSPLGPGREISRSEKKGIAVGIGVNNWLHRN